MTTKSQALGKLLEEILDSENLRHQGFRSMSLGPYFLSLDERDEDCGISIFRNNRFVGSVVDNKKAIKRFRMKCIFLAENRDEPISIKQMIEEVKSFGVTK